MQAGRLSTRCVIQRRTGGTNDWGEPVNDWQDVCSPWADIRQPSGLSAIKADAQISIVRTSVRIRFRDNVTAGMRVVHGAKSYGVKAVLGVGGKREFIDLVCEEVT